MIDDVKYSHPQDQLLLQKEPVIKKQSAFASFVENSVLIAVFIGGCLFLIDLVT